MEKYPTISEMRKEDKWPLEFISTKSLLPIMNQLSDRFQKPLKGVEVGVCTGESIAYLLESTNKIEHITGIDPYLEYRDWHDVISQDQMDEYKRVADDNLAPHAARYTLMHKSSFEVVDEFEDQSLDFVFIDGDHSYEGAKWDMIHWYPKVRNGGLFSGHDINLAVVEKALREFISGYNIQVHNNNVMTTTENAWWWIK